MMKALKKSKDKIMRKQSRKEKRVIRNSRKAKGCTGKEMLPQYTTVWMVFTQDCYFEHTIATM